MQALIDLIHRPGKDDWKALATAAFDSLFGAGGGRYPENARKSSDLRTADMEWSAVPYAGLIHTENPNSGPYSGMSLVIMPIENGPALLTLVVGTQGLSPDERILGRPGHARKVKAITQWLNREFGAGEQIAWAKQDPVRTDISIPPMVQKQFNAYTDVFKKYGHVIYAFFIPRADSPKVTEAALKSFADLYFDERGYKPLKAAEEDASVLQRRSLSHLMPDIGAPELSELLVKRRFVIIEGPPGTGKTRLAEQLLKDRYEGNGISIQFHPNTTYESFIGGLAPVQAEGGVGLQFSPTRGHLMEAVARARSTDRPYLLHIDEINRADLAKVLGEAIYLFEPSESRVAALAYDFGPDFHRTLSIPPNLHVIGTMNSADRSIAILDVAVRRRFAFVKLWPQISVVEKLAGEIMKNAFHRLLTIFLEEASDDAFALMPGHSYFLVRDDAEAVTALRTNLLPLLEEYLAQGYVANFSDAVRGYIQWLESIGV